MSATLSPSVGILRIITRSIVAGAVHAGHLMVALAESGPRMAQIRRLNETSDEELAARGLTRADEVRRIFGPRSYM